MGRFTDLLNFRTLGVAEGQQLAYDNLPQALRDSLLHPWTEPDASAHFPCRIVVGIGTYSVPDLELLDWIDNALAEREGACRVEVFNVLDCPDQAAVARFIPTIGFAWGTPVIGVWRDGLPTAAACGWKGRGFLEDAIAGR